MKSDLLALEAISYGFSNVPSHFLQSLQPYLDLFICPHSEITNPLPIRHASPLGAEGTALQQIWWAPSHVISPNYINQN